ncbi:hypothetical protein Syun_010790 [Stephania yunnanensis]|uniref:NADH dehydrogenase subunit 3 n=1 Tax=Stephania yunnanensis TaxID=152371 RepID=A0AAP0KH54_9MAGN
MLLYNLLFLALFFLLALAYDERVTEARPQLWPRSCRFAGGGDEEGVEVVEGKAGAAAAMVSVYLVGCGVISGVFGVVVVRGMGLGWWGGFWWEGLGWGLGGGQFGWVVGAECVLLCLQELPS